jgi:Cft2 family RNA processing exonuclease
MRSINTASSSSNMGGSGSELECLPYGVHHHDEGVCLLVRMGPYRILLDCGIADISPLQALEQPLDLVLCSHAHSDHARGLLDLHRAFPNLPIYASEVTTRLLPLSWQASDDRPIPQFCHALPWRSPIEFHNGLVVQLFPAGHLPGAAAILLTYTNAQRSYKLLYTGDFFLSNSRLVDGLPLEELRGLEPDVLIIEGSYGTARHPHRRTQENTLAERIDRAIASSHSVLLPTPTLGLGQEILMLLRSHHNFTGRDLDIWVDGSVATGCDAYLQLLPYLPAAVQNFARHQPLFWDERVRPRMGRLQSQRPISRQPCIVLTDDTEDLRQYCQPDPGSWIIFLPEKPGHSVENMMAASLPTTSIETYLLAQHSDGPGITQLIHNLRPQDIIFIHGSPTYLADLTSLEELQNRYHLHSPSVGTLVELRIGEMFLQPPAPPETSYEGELNELGSIVAITLPDTVTTDPRWRDFADTGLVSARWQGEELVLRGLSSRELLNTSDRDLLAWTNLNCCGTCRFHRGQRCWNQASPLFGFKVTPEGYCPVFERLNEPNDNFSREIEE